MKSFVALLLLAVTGIAGAQNPPYPGNRNAGQVDKAAIARLDLAQKKADEAFRRAPKDPAVRKNYIETNNRHGLACMVTDALDRKLKYKIALTDFRKVLKVDPKNAVAKENSDLIIAIYKSLGRPVPG